MNRGIRLAFFGSGTFGLPSLEAIAQSPHRILGIETPPSKPRGRGLAADETPIRAFARERGIPLLQLGDANAPASIKRLTELGAELFLVISYGTILSKAFLDLAPRGAVNLHASLLPKYRGASPVAYALMNGERETGVSTIRLTERLDAGDLLVQERLKVAEDETTPELLPRLAKLGASAVMKTLDLTAEDKLAPLAQDDRDATYAPKLKKEDAWINWSQPAFRIHNRVRAFASWPGSRTLWKDKELLILKTRVVKDEPPEGAPAALPGTVVDPRDPDGIRVATGQGDLLVRELQLEGRRPMAWKDFLNGCPVERGAKWGRQG